MNTFPSKHPSATFGIEIDFGQYSIALASASVAITVQSGIDAAPASVLSGSAQIVGGKVRQRVMGGVAGVRYLLTVSGTAGLDTWVHESVLPVAILI